MTPQFHQHAQQTELEHVSRIIPALVGVTLLMGGLPPRLWPHRLIVRRSICPAAVPSKASQVGRIPRYPSP